MFTSKVNFNTKSNQNGMNYELRRKGVFFLLMICWQHILNWTRTVCCLGQRTNTIPLSAFQSPDSEQRSRDDTLPGTL